MKILVGFLLALFISSQAYAQEEGMCGDMQLKFYSPLDIISGWYGLSTYENKFIRYEQGCLAVCEVTKKKATCSFPKNEDGIFD